MTSPDAITGKIYDAIVFITKPFGIPKKVCLDAAVTATQIIDKHIKQTNENAADAKESASG